MKIFTLGKEGIFTPGVATQSMQRVRMYPHGKLCSSIKHSSDDKFVSIGNGDQTTGRLLLARDSLPTMSDNKIYCADVIKKKIPFLTIFLAQEQDKEDLAILLFLKGVLKISQALMSNNDDYVIKLNQKSELTIESLEFGDLKVFNRLTPRDFLKHPIDIKIMSDSLYIFK
jgi:hypothetical protein